MRILFLLLFLFLLFLDHRILSHRTLYDRQSDDCQQEQFLRRKNPEIQKDPPKTNQRL